MVSTGGARAVCKLVLRKRAACCLLRVNGQLLPGHATINHKKFHRFVARVTVVRFVDHLCQKITLLELLFAVVGFALYGQLPL